MTHSSDLQETMDNKEKIFMAAANLFASQGYYKVSVREICQEADVTKPVLYYYFKDKEALLLELLKETRKVVEELKIKYFNEEMSFSEKLNGIIDVYIEFLTKYHHLNRFAAFIHFMSAPENVKEFKSKTGEEDMKELINIFSNAQKNNEVDPKTEPSLLATNFIGSILMIVTEYMDGKMSDDILVEKLRMFSEFWQSKFLMKKSDNGEN